MQTWRRLAAQPILLLAALAALALASCGEEEEDDAPGGSTAAGCADVEEPAAKRVSLARPPLDPPPKGTKVRVSTSCGDFEITLDVERAPKTTASFAHLVEEDVYDDTPIHRIVPDFVLQGGDPRGTGTGGPGYFVDEPPPPNLVYKRGVVAMAKTAAEPPGRSGSQFYVVTAADAGLPPDYALVGEVTSGDETLDVIEAQGDPAAGDTGTPLRPVVIESATLERP